MSNPDVGGDGAAPAATVALLRDRPGGLEVLMTRRTSTLSFGGMWVFPGGRVDPTDLAPGDTAHDLAAARRAAVREAREEVGLLVDESTLVTFSHWLPPPQAPAPFSTWFFVAPAAESAIVIEDAEIHEYGWLRPAEALDRHGAAEIDLAPPTWITLHSLARHPDMASALRAAAAAEPERFRTLPVRTSEGMVLLYAGDAGYDTGDAAAEGGRHRLRLLPGGWRYERD